MSQGTVDFETDREPIESQVFTQQVDEKPRFSGASTRICLRLQDRVVVLEEKLAKLDKRFSRREQEDVHNGSFRQEDDEREKFLDDMRTALSEYKAFMLQCAELEKFPKAPQQDIQSLLNWHQNHNSCAISEEEQNYLTHVHDLFGLASRIKTPLTRLLEKSDRFKLHWMWKYSEEPELPFYDKKETRYFSDNRIDGFVSVVIITLGTLMLIGPMWILPNLKYVNAKVGVITVFVVLFLGLVSYTTVAKPFETLAATAAYAAVLTVFLQSGNSV